MLKEMKSNNISNTCYENYGVFVEKEDINKETLTIAKLLDDTKNYRLSGTIYKLEKGTGAIEDYKYNIDMHLDLKNEEIININNNRDNFKYVNLFTNYEEAKKYTLEWIEDAYQLIASLEKEKADQSIMTKYYELEIGYNATI